MREKSIAPGFLALIGLILVFLAVDVSAIPTLTADNNVTGANWMFADRFNGSLSFDFLLSFPTDATGSDVVIGATASAWQVKDIFSSGGFGAISAVQTSNSDQWLSGGANQGTADLIFNESKASAAYVNKTTDSMTGNLTLGDALVLGLEYIRNQSDDGLSNAGFHLYVKPDVNSGLIFAVYAPGLNGTTKPMFAIQNGNDTSASYVVRSLMIVNENETFQNSNDRFKCDVYMDSIGEDLKIDCNTTTTGADLLVSDDTQIVGDVWLKDSDGAWHFLTRTLNELDRLYDNIVFNKLVFNDSVSGGTYTMDFFDEGGNTLIVNIDTNETIKTITTDGIALTAGTDIVPVLNFITYQQDTAVLTRTSSHPAVEHADVAQVMLGSVSGAVAEVYGWTNSFAANDEFISKVGKRFFDMGTNYDSGCFTDSVAANIAVDACVFDLIIDEINTTNNVSVTGAGVLDGGYYINQSGEYVKFTALSSLTQYQTGETIGSNKHFNVVWGIVTVNRSDHRIVAVPQDKPSTEYNTLSVAEADSFDAVNSFPNTDFIKKIFVPVARTVIKQGTWENQVLSNGDRHFDLRGSVSGIGGNSPAPSITSHANLDDLDFASAGHSGFMPDTAQPNIDGDNVTAGTVPFARLGVPTCGVGESLNATASAFVCQADSGAGGGSADSVSDSAWITSNGKTTSNSSVNNGDVNVSGNLEVNGTISTGTTAGLELNGSDGNSQIRHLVQDFVRIDDILNVTESVFGAKDINATGRICDTTGCIPASVAAGTDEATPQWSNETDGRVISNSSMANGDVLIKGDLHIQGQNASTNGYVIANVGGLPQMVYRSTPNDKNFSVSVIADGFFTMTAGHEAFIDNPHTVARDTATGIRFYGDTASTETGANSNYTEVKHEAGVGRIHVGKGDLVFRVIVEKTVRPHASGDHDLGTASFPWKDFYYDGTITDTSPSHTPEEIDLMCGKPADEVIEDITYLPEGHMNMSSACIAIRVCNDERELVCESWEWSEVEQEMDCTKFKPVLSDFDYRMGCTSWNPTALDLSESNNLNTLANKMLKLENRALKALLIEKGVMTDQEIKNKKTSLKGL